MNEAVVAEGLSLRERGAVDGAGLRLRVLLHYGAAIVIMGIYGGRVCPFIESLTLVQLLLPLLLVVGVQWGVHQFGLEHWIERARFELQVSRLFFMELGLFAGSGFVLGSGNYLVFDFPVGSGLKLVFGFMALGFFAAVDLALAHERNLVRRLGARGLHLDPTGPGFPLVRKFSLVAVTTVVIVVTVLFLVISKDLIWLSQSLDKLGIAEAQSSILKEFGFVAAVLLVHLGNVIYAYARNLGMFFANENQVLARATAGDLHGVVPVGTSDEFGQMAHHTNVMVTALRTSRNQLQRTQEATILGLGSLAETRDPETGAHILRTQRYVRALAEHLARDPEYGAVLTPETVELLFNSAPLHDVGKVGIPDRILLKPGKLDPEEFKIMMTHAALGSRALQVAEERLGGDSFLRLAREIAITHHEKWDGSGYPNGLRGEEIPLSGRLMAVADVYDALISKRVYKPAFPHSQAMEIILQGRGSHLDPRIVDALLAVEEQFKTIAAEFRDEH